VPDRRRMSAVENLSSSPVTRVRLTTLNINIVVAAGFEYEESG
jgi:hypothetical protein